MATVENDIVKEVEKLERLRIFLTLLSFAVGLALIRAGRVRAAILTVGAVVTVCGVGYILLKRAAMRSISAKTGKTADQLTKELANRRITTRSKDKR